MRSGDAVIATVTFVLGLITLTGMAYTERFPQAARAEARGFDALAHGQFDAPLLATNDNGAAGVRASEAVAQ